MIYRLTIATLAFLGSLYLPAHARTVYRCEQGGTVSLATAPEPGSRCTAREIADDAVALPNLWGELGIVNGVLYERVQDGATVYSTRKLPGSTKVLAFTVSTPAPKPAVPASVASDAGTRAQAAPRPEAPRLEAYGREFRSASRRTGVDEAWLRAIAHAESGFDRNAISPKGAMGVMQLMPATASELGVVNAFAPAESIQGAAVHLRQLMRLYRGNLELVAAAYNAGAGAVARHGGVPPFRETRHYVQRVLALHRVYRVALGLDAVQAVSVR